MQNIAFFSGDITKSGGTERVATIIANELCVSGKYNISFISLEQRNEEPFFYISDKIERYVLYPRLNRTIYHIVGIIRKVIKLKKEKGIDVIIDIDGILDMYSIPCKWLTGVKVISWEHFNYFQNPFVPYRKITRRMAARWADWIVTLTAEDKQYYQEHLKIKNNIKNIYNPIVQDGKIHGYCSESKLLLSVGRLTYQKGFDMLVDIAKPILDKNSDWKWVVLGEGEERTQLEEKIKKYGLEDRLILKGNVDNVNEYYVQASLFIMTSRFEGLPMTLLETKPYHLPLISFKCKTGPAELIEDGVNGFLIEQDDIKGMSNRIQQLIDSKKMRELFSANSQKDIERFKLETVVKQWENLLDNMREKDVI